MSRKVKVLITCFAILIAISAGIYVFVMNYLAKTKDYVEVFSTPGTSAAAGNEIDEKSESSPENDADISSIRNQDNIVNILLLGIDRTDYRDETLGVYRTDTILFASINLDTKKIKVLSIPRDSYVYIPAVNKKDKINHAYVWGGMGIQGIESTISTVENFIKYKKVDYYFTLDMEPLVEIVDSLGGVMMDVEIDMKTNGADLSAGYQLLDGQKAFDYIHWRFAGRGDIDRIERQQKFIKAITQKIKNNGNIIECLNIVLKYSKHIQTNLSTRQLFALANLYKELSEDDINFYSTPGHDETIDGISYWIPDEEAADIFKE